MDDQYCRLCMDEDNLCCMDSSIRDCIKNEFLLEIKDDDELSKEICRQCQARVSRIIEFRKEVGEFGGKISKVQKLLQKILKRKCKRTDSDPVKTTNEAAISTEETPRSSLSSSKTDTTDAVEDTNVSSSDELISKFIRSINMAEVEETAKKMQMKPNADNMCSICKTKCVDAAKFQKHLNSSTHIFKAYVIEKYGDADIFAIYTIGYKCPTCSKDFTSKRVLAAHSSSVHNKPLNRNLLKPNTLIPKNSKSNEDDSVQIDDDDLEFKIKEEPDSSAMIGNPISKSKAHPCVVCRKSFGFTESLQRHQQKHHKGTLFCIHCDFITISQQTFSNHIRKHYNLTYLQRVCSTCFKVCPSYSDLVAHRKEFHTKTIALVCLHCNACFPNSTLLKKHKRDEHRTKNDDVALKNKYKCRKCNRGFQTLMVLANHQCTSMKFPCVKKCGRRFETYGIMERHAAKCNSGKTIYFCQKCQKSLKTLTSLKTHLAKCSLKPSAPSTSKSNETAEKIRKASENSNEKNQASCSSTIYPSPAETNTSKRMKTDPEDHRNSFNCTNCYKTFPTATILENHQISCRTTLTRIETKLQRKSSKTKIKKPSRSKLIKVRKVPRPVKKKFIRVEKSSPHSSMENSKTEEKTMACRTCGLLFKDLEFLAQHESSVHTSAAHDRSKENTEVFQREENENIPANGLPEVSNFEHTPGAWKLKWKHTPSTPVNQNVFEVYDTTPSGLKFNSRLPPGQETKKNDAAVSQSDKNCLNWSNRETSFSKFSDMNQTPPNRSGVDRSVERRSSESKTISSSSDIFKVAEGNQTTSTRNDVDRSLEHRFSGPKTHSSKTSKIDETNQTTSTRNYEYHPNEYRSSGSNIISSSSRSSKIADSNQTSSTRNYEHRSGDNRSSGSNIISSSSRSSKIADSNQTASTRNYEHRCSGSTTISSSSEFSSEVNHSTPLPNDRRSTDNWRSEPKLSKSYSNSDEQEIRIAKTSQNDPKNRKSFQPQCEENCLDLSRRKSTSEKPIEMNSKRSNDYYTDRYSSRHQIPRPRSRWDCPDKRNTYNHRTPEQNRYSERNRSSFSSRMEPRVDSKQGSGMKSSSTAPYSSQTLGQDFKGTSKKTDLTIIPITQSICGICKNSNSHFFCNPCHRCFMKNEVQYFNHMKMKHS